jgi:aspartyl aminopeptidase
MLDAHAELSTLIAALSEESRTKVMAFFDRKMSSSYRNGRKAGLLEAGLKRSSAVWKLGLRESRS